MATESEIKFTVKEKSVFDDIAALAVIAGYTTIDNGIKKHNDTYFDTSDTLLFREKVVFRLRDKGSTSVLTFKAPGQSDEHVYRRHEIEEETTLSVKDIVAGTLPESPPVQALTERLGVLRLAPSLSVANNRHMILLARDNISMFELVLDDVTFTGPAGTRETLEVEVESITPDDSDLQRIGDWLSKRFPLHPAGPSKYILGMEHVGGLK